MESGTIGELYPRWIAFLFDRPGPDWYFDPGAGEFEAEGKHAFMAELVALTCRRAGEDLRHYTDAQLNAGFSYIFDNGASNVVFSLMARELPRPPNSAASRRSFRCTRTASGGAAKKRWAT